MEECAERAVHIPSIAVGDDSGFERANGWSGRVAMERCTIRLFVTNMRIELQRTIVPSVHTSILIIHTLNLVSHLLLNLIDVSGVLGILSTHLLHFDGLAHCNHQRHLLGERETPATEDDAHGALDLSGRLLEELGLQLQQLGVAKVVDGDNRSSRIHGGTNESLASRELDHLLIGLVDVHSGDTIDNHGAGTLRQGFAQTLVGGRDGTHPTNDRRVAGNDECTLGSERVG